MAEEKEQNGTAEAGGHVKPSIILATVVSMEFRENSKLKGNI